MPQGACLCYAIPDRSRDSGFRLSAATLGLTMILSTSCVFTSIISPTKGYHTAYTTKYTGDIAEGCSLHLAYTLPLDVFVDPYELKYDISSFELQPMPNLELPVKIATYNNSLLTVRLDSSASDGTVLPAIKIPVHARYGEPNSTPTSGSPSREIQLTAPRGYWSCPKRGREAADHMDTIECNSTLIVTNGSKGPQEVDSITLEIPVGSRSDLDVVEFSTTLVVSGLLAYLLWTFWNTAKRISHRFVTKKEQ